jgi:hypothetical protein
MLIYVMPFLPKTTAGNSQCNNSQAEVTNKTIAKYLASFVDGYTLDLEFYLCPLMFCYNMSFHHSICKILSFLTFGMEACQPALPGPELRRRFMWTGT